MQELKFRAFLKEPECIVDVEIIDFNEKYIVHENLNFGFENPGDIEPVDPDCVTKFNDCILMQTTGFKDKNYKEIYEGDILKYSIGKDIQCGPYIVEDIRGLYLELNRDDPYYLMDNENLEIIGNIYENSELIPANFKSGK